jgi:ribonuclease HI
VEVMAGEADVINIYTDGACKGNPGKGGWGALLQYPDREIEITGYDPQTTNNKMELTAAIEALRTVSEPSEIMLHSDSQYLVKGMTEWIKGWISRGWKTAQRKPVLNEELWKELLTLSRDHKIKWVWVKAHNGHPENERADRLANSAIGS